MIGQVKERIITRFGELGVEVRDGCLRFEPRLTTRSELLESAMSVDLTALSAGPPTLQLEPGSLAFTYCGVPIVYREGDAATVELKHEDGRGEHVDGIRLSESQSAALCGRRGTYRCLTVTLPIGSLHE